MGNNLNDDVTGRFVIIKADYIKTEYSDPCRRVFLATGGFGCMPFTIGNCVGGYFVDEGTHCREEGWMLERYATEEEVDKAITFLDKTKCDKQFLEVFQKARALMGKSIPKNTFDTYG